jgi:hypothetical protein
VKLLRDMGYSKKAIKQATEALETRFDVIDSLAASGKIKAVTDESEAPKTDK